MVAVVDWIEAVADIRIWIGRSQRWMVMVARIALLTTSRRRQDWIRWAAASLNGDSAYVVVLRYQRCSRQANLFLLSVVEVIDVGVSVNLPISEKELAMWVSCHCHSSGDGHTYDCISFLSWLRSIWLAVAGDKFVACPFNCGMHNPAREWGALQVRR